MYVHVCTYFITNSPKNVVNYSKVVQTVRKTCFETVAAVSLVIYLFIRIYRKQNKKFLVFHFNVVFFYVRFP